MPGRGQPWKQGGLPDNTVTSEDIKQGSIKQEDIDPAYQAIIEGGGGGGDLTKIGEFDIVTPQITMPMTLTSPITAGGFAEILIVSEFTLDLADDVDLTYTGPSFISTTTQVVQIDTTPALTPFNISQQDLIGSGENFSNSGTFNILKITLRFDTSGGLGGTIDEIFSALAPLTRRGGFTSDTQDPTTITALTLQTKGVGSFQVGSKVRAYALAL